MKTYTITCPSCEANLDVREDEGLDFIYCRYCGNKCAIDYGSMAKQINYTKKLKSDENKYDKKLRHDERVLAMKMRQENKKRKDEEERRAAKGVVIGLAVAWGIVIILFLMFEISSCQEKKIAASQENNGKIKVDSHLNYEGENFEDIANLLSGKGFTDVQCIKLNESSGLFKDKDEIKQIIIDGNEEFESETYFSKDAPVRIYYYGD